MNIVGLTCEYNPFHYGHVYHIEKIKEILPDSILVLVLNGYFLERGEISILSKEDKTKLALEFGIDLVVELPVVFGTQSADIFAEKAIEILHHLSITDIVFGSECNDVAFLEELANKQLSDDFNKEVKRLLKEGVNYPTALAKALHVPDFSFHPNDLLGISYAKAIIKQNYSIRLHTIKRTSGYHDKDSMDSIISAQNIRFKLKNGMSISDYVPPLVLPNIKNVDETLLWNLIQMKIRTSNQLESYLTVDEGIEARLLKEIKKAASLEDFLERIKTKRYTYNKLSRMLVHLLLGFTKEVNTHLSLEYIHVLGFNKKGQDYLKSVKEKIQLPLQPIQNSTLYQMELRASFLYDMLTNSDTSHFEIRNKPVIFDKKEFISYNKDRKK